LTPREYALFSGVSKTWDDGLIKQLGERLVSDFVTDIREFKTQGAGWSVQKQELGLRRLLRLYSLLFESRHTSIYARAAELAALADSEQQARRVYEVLPNSSADRQPKVLLGFLGAGDFFQGVVRCRGCPTLIVTTAFEKETGHLGTLKYYKHSRFTDEQWRSLSDEERIAQISKDRWLSGEMDFTSKTSDAPHYFARHLMSESLNSGHYLFEFTQDRYALTPQDTIRRIREVALWTGETHSFHVQVVGEVPRGSKSEFSKFAVWHWEANIQSMLQGMEEGLFGRALTSHLKRPTEGATFDLSNSNKLLSIGYRQGIYGASQRRDFTRIGLELRDVSRRLGVLEDLISKFLRTMAGRIWKKAGPVTNSPLRLGDLELREVLRSRGVSRYAIDVMNNSQDKPPILQLPLLDFKSIQVVNWKSGQMAPIDPSVLKRLDEGREYYLSGLVALGSEIDQFSRQGVSLHKDEVSRAIKIWLKEWAMKFRPKEIYSAY